MARLSICASLNLPDQAGIRPPAAPFRMASADVRALRLRCNAGLVKSGVCSEATPLPSAP